MYRTPRPASTGLGATRSLGMRHLTTRSVGRHTIGAADAETLTKLAGEWGHEPTPQTAPSAIRRRIELTLPGVLQPVAGKKFDDIRVIVLEAFA